MKKIAVLTSGGDAPGMNAAIRAVVRKSIYHGLEIYGIKRGYSGLINREIEFMKLGSVADIIHRGGTILRTARCPEFLTRDGQEKAFAFLREQKIDGLVVIGGDGSFRGAKVLEGGFSIPVVFRYGSITISPGPSTALELYAVNTVLMLLIRCGNGYLLSDLCQEVMGRHTDLLLTGRPAEERNLYYPEAPSISARFAPVMRGKRGKLHSVILVAEGAASAISVGKEIRKSSRWKCA